eukprot:9973762-Heterocapsa_arctica.AAC.1
MGASPEQLSSELIALGLPPGLRTNILDDARVGQCLLTRAGASPELTAMVADMHTPTWFAVGNSIIDATSTVVHAV